MDRPREHEDRRAREGGRTHDPERWSRERDGSRDRDEERWSHGRDEGRWFGDRWHREGDDSERHHPGAREAWRAVDRGREEHGPWQDDEQWSRGYEQRWPGDAPWQTRGAHARMFEHGGESDPPAGRGRGRYQDWGRVDWQDQPEWQAPGEPHRETRPRLAEAYGSDQRSANGPTAWQGTGGGFGRHESRWPDPNVFNHGPSTGRRPEPRGEREQQRGRFAGVGPKNYRRSDERLYEEICERLSIHPDIDPGEIEIRVQDAEVTLTGTVDSRGARHLAEDICDGVTGVRDVHNELRVTRAGEEEARRGNS